MVTKPTVAEMQKVNSSRTGKELKPKRQIREINLAAGGESVVKDDGWRMVRYLNAELMVLISKML